MSQMFLNTLSHYVNPTPYECHRYLSASHMLSFHDLHGLTIHNSYFLNRFLPVRPQTIAQISAGESAAVNRSGKDHMMLSLCT